MLRRVRLSALNSHVYVQSLRCIPAHPQAAGTVRPHSHVVTIAGGHGQGHVKAVKAGVTASTLTLALASETSRGPLHRQSDTGLGLMAQPHVLLLRWVLGAPVSRSLLSVLSPAALGLDAAP